MIKRRHIKKVAIVTITNGPNNYGNQLQNFAMIKIFEYMGIDSETLYDIYNAKYKVNIRHKIKNRLFTILRISEYYKAKRELVFNSFSKKYLHYTGPIDGMVSEKIVSQYDYFIAGSDQVWNPAFSISSDHWKYYLLAFAPVGKRISYAASIGVSEMDEAYKTDFITELLNYTAISVREESGQRIIKELTGRDAEVLIDPTLMLDRSDWLKIAKTPKKVDTDKPYILTYFLGGYSDRINQTLQNLAEEYSCEVYNLMDMTQPEVYVSGPSEFIYLISKAKLVLTDSFHACVFSFLFGKPFVVYAREGEYNNMMSRMDTLLKKFGLERKYVDNGLPNDILECNYQHGYEVLASERQKVINYLKKAMHIQ